MRNCWQVKNVYSYRFYDLTPWSIKLFYCNQYRWIWILTISQILKLRFSRSVCCCIFVEKAHELEVPHFSRFYEAFHFTYSFIYNRTIFGCSFWTAIEVVTIFSIDEFFINKFCLQTKEKGEIVFVCELLSAVLFF